MNQISALKMIIIPEAKRKMFIGFAYSKIHKMKGMMESSYQPRYRVINLGKGSCRMAFFDFQT